MNHQIELASADGARATIALSGDLDASNYDEFYGYISGVYEKSGKDICLDCTGLNFIDSTILGGIIKIYKQLKADGRSLVIKNLQPRIRKLFEICALDKLLELE